MQSGQTFRKILKFDLIVRFRIWISKLRSFRSREGLFDCSEFQCCWSLFWRTPTQRLKDWISNIVNIMIFRIQSLEFNTRLLYYSLPWKKLQSYFEIQSLKTNSINEVNWILANRQNGDFSLKSFRLCPNGFSELAESEKQSDLIRVEQTA